MRLGLYVLGVVTFCLVWYAGQVVLLDWMQPGRLDSNLSTLQGDVHPDTPIQISLNGYGAELSGVQLYRLQPTISDQELPVTVLTERDGPASWRLVVANGLRPDSSYRLMVDASAPRPFLPLPARERITQQYRFETVRTPYPALPASLVQPRWGEAVPISWSLPLNSVRVAVEPEADAEAWVDPADATRTWVKLAPDAPSGQVYSVKFMRAVGLDGMTLQQPTAFQLAVPPRPSFENAPTEPVVLKQGETFDLTSNVPLTDIEVQSDGDLQARATLDGQRIRLGLTKYRQGEETVVTVAGATTTQGAPLKSPLEFVLKTPPAMELPKFVPENKAQAVPLRSRPYLEFESPPANPDSVRRSITMRPAIKGEWNWLDDVTLVFTPAERLPAQTTVSVTLRSGPDGPRTEAGGFLDKDLVTSFVTAPNRRIEISIGKQQLYMYENEKLIKTITVGTGVPGADTPPGQYEVLYKMPKTRMQGVNPSGARYDLPDVPWVLPFMGDYAIHGVYWRNNFGTTASNGCVGMTVEEAKMLYDWADVGTPIRIYR
jgi:hypothetical protein